MILQLLKSQQMNVAAVGSKESSGSASAEAIEVGKVKRAHAFTSLLYKSQPSTGLDFFPNKT
jgi:hypothetical protein